MNPLNEADAIVEKLAAAVLYEGHTLYPYRPALKNQQRWTFGCLFPKAYSAAHEHESAVMQTECLVEGNDRTAIDVKVRFLHLKDRRVCQTDPKSPGKPADGQPAFQDVESLKIGDQEYLSWQETVERLVEMPQMRLGDICQCAQRKDFRFPASRNVEFLYDPDVPRVAGRLDFQQHRLEGSLQIRAMRLNDDYYRLTVTIENAAPLQNGNCSREEALMHALVSTHTILAARDGAFVSSIDPPANCRPAVAACCNRGTWPVLVGEDGQRQTILSAPIILYDYPQIADESPGDLFDATEIDEILSLRIRTLTDGEKQQMAAVEQHTRALLERTETLDADALLRLHGKLRTGPSESATLQ